MITGNKNNFFITTEFYSTTGIRKTKIINDIQYEMRIPLSKVMIQIYLYLQEVQNQELHRPGSLNTMLIINYL